MNATEFLRRFDAKHLPEVDVDDHGDQTMQSMGRHHTIQRGMRTGTAFDWEDLDRYREELDRMDREALH